MQGPAKRLRTKLEKVFGATFIQESNIDDKKLEILIDQDHSIVSILRLIQKNPNDQELIDIGLKQDQIDVARAIIRNLSDEIVNSWRPVLNDDEIETILQFQVGLRQLIELDPYTHGYRDYMVPDYPSCLSCMFDFVYSRRYKTDNWNEVDTEMHNKLAETYRKEQRLFNRPPDTTFASTVQTKDHLKSLFTGAFKDTINIYLRPRYELVSETNAGIGRSDLGLIDLANNNKLVVAMELKIDPVGHLISLEQDERSETSIAARNIEENRINQIHSYMVGNIKYGILSTMKRTFIFEKSLDIDKASGQRIVKMSRMFHEREALKAIFFVCLKGIEDYEKSLEKGESETSSNRPSDQLDEEDDDNEDYKLNSPLSTGSVNWSSQYQKRFDIVHSEEELASFFARQSLYKIVLDYEETGSYDPYSSGLSGIVFLGHATPLKASQTSERVRCAAKIAELAKFPENTGLDLCQEARILNYLNQLGVQCVPKLLYAGFLDSNAYFTVIIEFIGNARHFNLATLKPRRANLLAKAVNQLHAAGVHHGDLESRNVLFQSIPGQPERCVIIDFACSTLFDKPRSFKVLDAKTLKYDSYSLVREFNNEKKFLFVARKRTSQLLEKVFSDLRKWFDTKR